MKPVPMPRVTPAQERQLVRRALAQYYRDNPDGGDYPDHRESSVQRRRGLNYVVLVNEEWDQLAVYRVRHNGALMFYAAAME